MWDVCKADETTPSCVDSHVFVCAMCVCVISPLFFIFCFASLLLCRLSSCMTTRVCMYMAVHVLNAHPAITHNQRYLYISIHWYRVWYTHTRQWHRNRKKKQIRPLMVDAVCAVFAIMARLHKWYSRHIYLYVVGCCVLSCVCVFNVIPICLISMLLFSLLLLLLFLFNDNKRVCE